MRSAVAILFFRRPDMLARVFAAIRKARPPRLFLVADGPRPGNAADAADVARARRVVAKVGWPCRVERIYADRNLGCGRRISSGLDLVFSRVPEAVILEDDTLPTPGFFHFMDQMLARYRRDERVGCVCGVAVPSDAPASADLRFSRYAAVWGWGSWARFWRHYQFGLDAWKRPGGRRPLCAQFEDDARARDYWSLNFWRAGLGALDTWDYQLTEALWRRGALAAHSRVGLVRNIGAADATHPDADPDPDVLTLPLGMLPARMRLPRQVCRDAVFDAAVEHRHYSGRWAPAGLLAAVVRALNAAAEAGLMGHLAPFAARYFEMRRRSR